MISASNNEAPSTSRSGYLFPTASSGAESLRSGESSHSSTALRPWYSAKEDKILTHSGLVAVALGVSYFIAKTPLSDYSLQISGLLVAIYMLLSFLIRKKFLNPATRVPFDIFVFSFAVSLLLFSTGGFSSPVFFLTYFLLFGISLLSAPTTSLVAALVFAILFILTPKADFWTEVLQVASLLAIAPISMAFGRQYLEILKNEQKIKLLKNIGQDFVEEIKSQEEEVRNWTDGDFRLKLVGIQRYLGELLKDPSLDKDKKKKINDLYGQIYELFLSGMEMKKEVEK